MLLSFDLCSSIVGAWHGVATGYIGKQRKTNGKGFTTMKCAFCHTENADGTRFCFSCGKPMVPLPSGASPASSANQPSIQPVSQPSNPSTPNPASPDVPPMPNAQPPMPTTPPPLPASATGKAAGAAMSKKVIAAIVAAVLVGATGAGVGISFAAGAWGRNDKPAAAQTADDKASKKTAKTDADKSDASKKKQNAGGNKAGGKYSSQGTVSERKGETYITRRI